MALSIKSHPYQAFVAFYAGGAPRLYDHDTASSIVAYATYPVFPGSVGSADGNGFAPLMVGVAPDRAGYFYYNYKVSEVPEFNRRLIKVSESTGLATIIRSGVVGNGVPAEELLAGDDLCPRYDTVCSPDGLQVSTYYFGGAYTIRVATVTDIISDVLLGTYYGDGDQSIYAQILAEHPGAVDIFDGAPDTPPAFWTSRVNATETFHE